MLEFYRSRPSAGNKQSIHIVIFLAGRTPSCSSAGHTKLNTKVVFNFETRGAFHQAFCQCFSLTNLLSANQMQGFQ